MRVGIFVIGLLLMLAIRSVESKKVHADISVKQLLRSPHTAYLTRFGISNSGANITLKFKLLDRKAEQLSFLRVGIVHAQNYYYHKNAKTCEEKEQLYHESYQMRFFDPSEGMTVIKMGRDKNEHLGFFFVYACQFVDNFNEAGSLSIDVIMSNNGVGLEEYGIMLWPYLAMFVVCIVVIVRYHNTVREELEARKNIASLMLCGAFVVFVFTLMFKFFSIAQLMISGQSIPFFDALYIALKIILEVLLCSILTSIAWGWLLNNVAYRLHFIAIVVVVSGMNILSQLLADLNRQQVTNQHLYQGKVGKLVLAMRILICAAFVAGCVYVSTKSNPRRQSFINSFAEVGSIFLLANVIALTLSKLFSHSYRHGQVIPILQDMIELTVCGYLCYLFAYPRENKPEYEEIGIFGFDMEMESMIDRDEPVSPAKQHQNGRVQSYQGKQADLI